jgi:hypothetical protein
MRLHSIARPRRFLLFALLLALAFHAAAAPAAPLINTVTWDATGGGVKYWGDAVNWSTNVVPGPLDVATFNGTSVLNCVIDVPVCVQGIDVAAGYSGTISVAARNGLYGEYFNNPDAGPGPSPPRTSPPAQLALVRVDGTAAPGLSFDWAAAAPAPELFTERFLVRWSGQVLTTGAGLYTFTTRTDDGARLWVNGIRIIDFWIDQGATDRTGTITLPAATLIDVVFEMYENGGNAYAELRWTPPGGSDVIIPPANLWTKPSIDLGRKSGLRAQH